jgi:hypothetical protein
LCQRSALEVDDHARSDGDRAEKHYEDLRVAAQVVGRVVEDLVDVGLFEAGADLVDRDVEQSETLDQIDDGVAGNRAAETGRRLPDRAHRSAALARAAVFIRSHGVPPACISARN